MADNIINLGNAAPASPVSTPIQPAGKITFAPSNGGVNKTESSPAINIFAQQEAKNEGSKMIESIVAGKSEAAARLKPILGGSPQLQKTLEQEREFRKKKQLRLVQTVFSIVFLATLAMSFYFYSQLDPNFTLFGANTTTQLAGINKNLLSLQTTINKYRYLSSQIDLNRLSYDSASFFDAIDKLGSAGTSGNDSLALKATILKTKNSIPKIISDLKTNFDQPLVIPTVRSAAEPLMTDDEKISQAENDLRAALTPESTTKTQDSAQKNNSQDLKLNSNTIKLVGNKNLISAINNISVDDFTRQLNDYADKPAPGAKRQLQATLGKILSSTQSDVATIGAIKNSRVTWSTVINEIQTVTGTVIKNNSSDLKNAKTYIHYTGYEFDSQTNKIVLSGTTKTEDATNFSLMSRLIDSLGDPQFAFFTNVEMRSFNKSGDPSSGYLANFKIDLNLLSDGATTATRPISLGADMVLEKAKTRRIAQ